MRKILFSIIALVTMMISSCSNDDIEIKTVGKLYNLSYNISTQGVYDEFEITDNVREILREQSYALGVISFVYDKDGNLVAKKPSSRYDFNNIKKEFEGLLEGKYTIVSIETLVKADKNFEAINWSIKGEDKISTLEISQDTYEVYYPFVLGVCTNEINLTSNQSVTATPKAIGSLIELCWINFDKSTNVEVGFATNDIIGTYRLDPSVSRVDRYNTDVTSVGYINLRAIRSIDGEKYVFATRYILEKSIDYSFVFKKKENEGSGTWTSYNANHGSMLLEDGKRYFGGMYYIDDYTACKTYLGDEKGFRAWLESLNNLENNSLVPTLHMKWGDSVSNVQSTMKNYTLTLGTTGKAVLQDDGSYAISYKGKNKENNITYSFTSATTGLFEIDVRYSKSAVSSSDILTYMQNNYLFLAEDSGMYMYCTNDFATYVLFWEMNGEWIIGYVDVNYVNNMDSKRNAPAYNKLKSISPKSLMQKGTVSKDAQIRKKSVKLNKYQY